MEVILQNQNSNLKSSEQINTNYHLRYLTGSNNSEIFEIQKIEQIYPPKYKSLDLVLKMIKHDQENDQYNDEIIHQSECDHLHNEVEILSQLNHKNIIHPISNIHQTQQYCALQLPLAYCDLFDFIVEKNEYTLAYAKIFFHQALDALKYLKQQNIAHNDLKLENLFIFKEENQSYKMVLADFGFAQQQQTNQIQDGKEQFHRWENRKLSTIAPEMIQKINQNDTITYADEFASDIFCLGSCLFQSIFKKYPQKNIQEGPSLNDEQYSLLLQQNGEQLFYQKIAQQNQSIFKKFSLEINIIFDLIVKMIHPDITKRITVEEAYEHVWFTN